MEPQTDGPTPDEAEAAVVTQSQASNSWRGLGSGCVTGAFWGGRQIDQTVSVRRCRETSWNLQVVCSIARVGTDSSETLYPVQSCIRMPVLRLTEKGWEIGMQAVHSSSKNSRRPSQSSWCSYSWTPGSEEKAGTRWTSLLWARLEASGEAIRSNLRQP